MLAGRTNWASDWLARCVALKARLLRCSKAPADRQGLCCRAPGNADLLSEAGPGHHAWAAPPETIARRSHAESRPAGPNQPRRSIRTAWAGRTPLRAPVSSGVSTTVASQIMAIQCHKTLVHDL